MKYKQCPFCGSRVVVEKIPGIPIMFFRCTNYNGCGATISFDNPESNANGETAVKHYNRRATVK